MHGQEHTEQQHAVTIVIYPTIDVIKSALASTEAALAASVADRWFAA